MAISMKLEDEISHSCPSSSLASLNEAMLTSTMCIIGLQVHVHIKDGSIFSGIFYTISLENEFGIVLKYAKLTKKGTSKSNVASGNIVETLVIMSSDIVRIVAEGVSLPSNFAGNIEGENVVSAIADFPSEPQPRSCIIANKPIKSGIDRRGTNHRRNSAKLENRLENKVKSLKSGKNQELRSLSPSCTKAAMKDPGRKKEIGIAQNKHHPSFENHQRKAGARILKCNKQNTDVHQEDNVDAQSSSSSSVDSRSKRVQPIEQEKIMPEPSSNGSHEAAERPSLSENPSPLDENSEMSNGFVVSSNKLLPIKAVTDPVKKAKEFKLNPGAKIFSPSITKCLSSTPAGTTHVVANMGYVPSNTPMLPVPEAVQPDIGMNPFLPHASSKFVPYTNLAAGNTGGGSHFPHHMVGPSINRGQPHRFTSQYHSVQATPPNLVNPNPQDLVQGAQHHSHLPSRPLFAPQQQFQYPKHQNLIVPGQPMQLYAPQPFAASGHQPYAVMPTNIPNIPVMQPPFPTNQPIPIPVPNGFFGTKFL